jgi:hypothetical protein
VAIVLSETRPCAGWTTDVDGSARQLNARFSGCEVGKLVETQSMLEVANSGTSRYVYQGSGSAAFAGGVSLE